MMPSNPAAWLGRIFPTAHRLALEAKIAERLPTVAGAVLVLGAGHDPYRDMLSQASSVLTTDISDEHGTIDRIVDAHDLPFDDGSFDCVLAIEVFEHLAAPPKASRELLRVLKAGGKGVVSIPFMFHVHGDPYDFSRLTKTALEKLFEGASSVSVAEMGGRLHVVSDIITTAARPLAAMRCANHIFRLPYLRNLASADCPSGYWVEVTK